MENVNGFRFKEGFMLGTASAATQVEGGTVEHSWLDWCRRGKIKDGSSVERADDHYRRYEEDIALMSELGMSCCRFGVEWARIEPEEGVFSEEALAHYRRELMLLREKGILPLVTLHHFTNPMWFERRGAFEREENIPLFLRFVEKTVRAFGELAEEYITINEPNVYAVNGYFFGEWPPGDKSFSKTVRVMSVLTACHIGAYRTIHEVRAQMGLDGTKVSFANHLRAFVPKNPKNSVDRAACKFAERCFQGSLSKAMMLGTPEFPIRRVDGYSAGRYCDFIAVNYYTRTEAAGTRMGFRGGAPVNDLGWEIYPAGLTECAAEMYALLPLPVYITENGTCDGQDSFRCRYLYDHLKAVSESPLPFERYYHWCFTDNFEWLEGESARFGIVEIDYESQRRTVKTSGRFYAEMASAGGVSEEMYRKYVAPQQYQYSRQETEK